MIRGRKKINSTCPHQIYVFKSFIFAFIITNKGFIFVFVQESNGSLSPPQELESFLPSDEKKGQIVESKT